MTNIECPVCKATITGNVCETCGYARIIFPKNIPDNIVRFENERVDALRKIRSQSAATISEVRRDADSAQRRAESLGRDLDEAQKRNSRLDHERQTLKNENDRMTNDIRALTGELDSFRSRSSSQEKNLNDQLARLNTKVSAQTSEITSLQTALADANRQFLDASGNNEASAYLIFNDGCDYTVYPLASSGSAFFASGPGHTDALSHREGVALFPVITGVEIAFEIRPDGRGFKVIDYCNTLRKEGLAVKGSERLMNKDTLSFNGTSFKAWFTLPPRKR